jgi:D-alanyl-D-alanine carboxypeptidase
MACGAGDKDGVPPSPAATAIPTKVAFGEGLTGQLQEVLDAAVANPETGFPGAILRVSRGELGVWVGTAGLGEIETKTPVRSDDKFRAGSIMKTFVAVVVLQLVEEGSLSLDDRLPDVLPERLHSGFLDSDKITVRMLLNHTSGLPEWLSPAVIGEIVSNPAKIWDVTEFLNLSAGQSPNFAPGSAYAYSNTDYNVLGAIIESVTDRSWRDEVTERVIEPLNLGNTLLPEPGNVSVPGNHVHGYGGSADAIMDLTAVDPSMAGAAGGGALVTTVSDLARFLDSVLSGELFDNDETLQEMMAFIDAPGEGGQVGYGFGLQRYVLPGGTEVIGHLGSTAGYTAFVGHLTVEGITVAAVLNSQGDPSPVLVPVIEILVAEDSQ